MSAAGVLGSSADLPLMKYSYPISLSPPPSSSLFIPLCIFLLTGRKKKYSLPIQVIKAENMNDQSHILKGSTCFQING